MSTLELAMMKRVGELNAEVKQLQAEVARLQNNCDYLDQKLVEEIVKAASYAGDIARLHADNERLRQAVTYLCSTMEVNGIHDNGDIEMHDRAIALGRAALKEGHNK